MNVVVTVARKPLAAPTVAANTLLHGAGGYAIDATRIGYAGGEVDFSKVQRQQHSGGVVEGAFGAASLVGKEVMTYKPGGRWPPNCLFQHLPSCQRVGTRAEPGPPINRFTDGMKPFGEGAGHSFETVKTPDVSVDVWACGVGCPVADLDDQSGDRPSGGSATTVPRSVGLYEDGLKRRVITPRTDSGGASRYFKQFQEGPKS